MSQDVIRPLLKAVADLPSQHTGLVLHIINELRGREASQISERLKAALTPVAKAVVKLLEFVGEVVVSATTEVFSASKTFIVDKSPQALVKISFVSENFINWFLQGNGKVEVPIGEQTLRYAKLRQRSVDTPIIEELGGEAKAETTLTELYALMLKQRNGEAGSLLTNGWANIFYIIDSAGVLRAVYVYWSGGGWDVDAGSTSHPDQWGDGGQVFSRCS